MNSSCEDAACEKGSHLFKIVQLVGEVLVDGGETQQSWGFLLS